MHPNLLVSTVDTSCFTTTNFPPGFGQWLDFKYELLSRKLLGQHITGYQDVAGWARQHSGIFQGQVTVVPTLLCVSGSPSFPRTWAPMVAPASAASITLGKAG